MTSHLKTGVKSINIFKRSYVFCILLISLFTLGYFIGVIMNSGLCLEKYEVFSKFESKTNLVLHKTFLVIIIFTAPKNFERRNSIRHTWLNLKHANNMTHYFAIGTASLLHEEKFELEQENIKNNDLLLLSDFGDLYSKLSEKLLKILQWLKKNLTFVYLLKVDDDTFVRLDVLYDEMVNKPQKMLYWGFFDGRAAVKRKGKWKEDKWNLCDYYLPYAKGGGYIITQDLVHYVAKNSHYLSLYKNEDITLGAWLAPLNVNRIHDPRFDTEYQSRGCLNVYLVTHKQSISMMYNKYENLKKYGKICDNEFQKRYSYVYNWKVPPSQCCFRNDTNIP